MYITLLLYLLTREIAHTKMFMKALESLGKLTEPMFGNVKPDDTVKVYYHFSSNGAAQRGPWNQEPEFTYVADPVKMIEHGELAGAGPRKQGLKNLGSFLQRSRLQITGVVTVTVTCSGDRSCFCYKSATRPLGCPGCGVYLAPVSFQRKAISSA